MQVSRVSIERPVDVGPAIAHAVYRFGDLVGMTTLLATLSDAGGIDYKDARRGFVSQPVPSQL
jgi:hypothetical protein